LKPGDVCLALRGLHSVLLFNEDDGLIEQHHASFCDYLRDRAQSGSFYVGDPQLQ
ncbi:hypothetical protein B0H12DRAFT_972461, partial [Mycena haematopus]